MTISFKISTTNINVFLIIALISAILNRANINSANVLK